MGNRRRTNRYSRLIYFECYILVTSNVPHNILITFLKYRIFVLKVNSILNQQSPYFRGNEFKFKGSTSSVWLAWFSNLKHFFFHFFMQNEMVLFKKKLVLTRASVICRTGQLIIWRRVNIVVSYTRTMITRSACHSFWLKGYQTAHLK